MNQYYKKIGLIALLSLSGAVFGGAHFVLADSSEVSGWIPWWNDTSGLKSATAHLRDIDTVYPFVYEVNSVTGALVDRANLSETQWKTFFSKAKQSRVEVIPTVAWFDGPAMERILSDEKLRTTHKNAIVAMVKKGGFAGVNIDYEAKLAATRDDFSLFLKELNTALGRAILTCTVEARTPPESRWREVPSEIEYANDYRAINKYCDRIEIMAYDQQRADLLLNDARRGMPYIPVADPAWVEKVLVLALKDFAPEKVILGVPTYGRQWDVTVAPEWYKDYTSVGALNRADFLEIATKAKVTPSENVAGEMSFSYFPDTSPYRVLNALPVPSNTPKGMEAAAKALHYANASGQTVVVRVAWYSDANSVADKMKLAKKYKLRGIALFKIDGEEDARIWSAL